MATKMVSPASMETGSPAQGGGSSGPAAGALTRVSWLPTEQLTLEQWILQGRRLGALGRGVAWWIGDWLRYGNAAYGEKYVRAARVTGYDVQTLMNMAYVASRFDVSRRRESLSWSHHAELAAHDPEDQERWLDRVERDGLSVACLRIELRRARAIDAQATDEGCEEERPAPRSRHTQSVCPSCGHALAAAPKPRELAGASA